MTDVLPIVAKLKRTWKHDAYFTTNNTAPPIKGEVEKLVNPGNADGREERAAVKDFPTDPMRQHSRFMAAFCDDLMAGDYHTPRAKAVCEICRQINQPREAAQPNKQRRVA